VLAIAAAPGDDWRARLATAIGADGDQAGSVSDVLAKLGLTPSRPLAAATRDGALTLIPSLRFNELWGPRQYAPRAAMQSRLAGMTLAWLELAGIGAELAGRDLGMQELTTIWTEQAPIMYVAARWTDVPRIEPGPLELPGVDPGGIVRALGQACVDNRKARRTLAAVASPILVAADPIDRVTALKLAEPVLRAAFA
jgi:hypothetical protein